MTLQEYFSTPETVVPQELIFGAMRVAESPTSNHQQVVGDLYLSLRDHLRFGKRGTVWLAPLDVVLDVERALVVQPDLFVILNDGSAATVLDKVYGPPDLVIEVLSPRPRIGDVVERVAWFRDYGVRECWLVHQLDHRMEVLEFEGGLTKSRRDVSPDDAITSSVLPGFTATPTTILGY